MHSLTEYKTLVFDCDGVVLNSNFLKIDAYYATAKNFGASDHQAQSLVDYHIKLGGISRFVKFDYFLKNILNQPATAESIQLLLDGFGREVEKRLMDCEIAPSLELLREKTKNSHWMMVSGGDQNELRKILAVRGIAQLFDAGIFGSPDNKDTILARELANNNLQMPAIFFGDSRYDHEASTNAGLDFVFMKDWTDFSSWPEYSKAHNIRVCGGVADLMEAL